MLCAPPRAEAAFCGLSAKGVDSDIWCWIAMLMPRRPKAFSWPWCVRHFVVGAATRQAVLGAGCSRLAPAQLAISGRMSCDVCGRSLDFQGAAVHPVLCGGSEDEWWLGGWDTMASVLVQWGCLSGCDQAYGAGACVCIKGRSWCVLLAALLFDALLCTAGKQFHIWQRMNKRSDEVEHATWRMTWFASASCSDALQVHHAVMLFRGLQNWDLVSAPFCVTDFESRLRPTCYDVLSSLKFFKMLFASGGHVQQGATTATVSWQLYMYSCEA